MLAIKLKVYYAGTYYNTKNALYSTKYLQLLVYLQIHIHLNEFKHLN